MSVCENAIVEIKPTIEQLVNAIRPINGEDGTEEDILQNDINQSIRCTLCNKTFKNRGSALFHVKKTHSINISTNINLLLGINKKTNNLKYHFFCPVQSCKRISTIKYFLSTKLLIQHFQKTHYDKKLKCNFCTAKFALERDLRYHIKKICPKQKEFNKNIFNNCCDKSNGTIKKNTASQTEKWLVPTKIVLAGKFDKIYPKRKITTEKHNYTQTELIYPQLQQEIQSSKIILNNNYQQNTINLINQQQYLNNNNIIFNNYQTVEESTQTAYCRCPPSSSFDFISEDIEREGESLLRNNGWTQTPPFYSFELCNNNLMEMQSTSVQTDNTIIIPSIWNL